MKRTASGKEMVNADSPELAAAPNCLQDQTPLPSRPKGSTFTPQRYCLYAVKVLPLRWKGTTFWVERYYLFDERVLPFWGKGATFSTKRYYLLALRVRGFGLRGRYRRNYARLYMSFTRSEGSRGHVIQKMSVGDAQRVSGVP